MFDLYFTEEADKQLDMLQKSRTLQKRYKAVVKALRFLSSNPRHQSLNTHEYTTLSGPNDEKVFEAYAEQSTPAAYRIFWYYGPEKDKITVVSIVSHP